MNRTFKVAILGILMFTFAGTSLAQRPELGTWKLNVEKSRYVPGPGPKSMTRTVESQGDKEKFTYEGVAADGSAVSYNFTLAFDGKDYPIVGSGVTGGADTVSVKQLTPRSFRATLKKAGAPVLISSVTISPDGKVTTFTQTGPSGKGSVHNVIVYEKQ
jgi:hypothetical protein